jgi:hypothetical protein
MVSMRTIPAAWAALLCENEKERALCEKNMIFLGVRPEVDVDTVTGHDVALGSKLTTALAGGIPPGAAGTVVLSDETQQTGGADKRDLRESYDALCEHPSLSALTNLMLSPEVDEGTLKTLCAQLSGSFTREDDEVCARVWLPPEGFTQTLGGWRWPGESHRGFALYARHAQWRDRRVRRLSRVVIYSHVIPGQW